MKVVWRPRAEADLTRQAAWLQENRSGKAALSFLLQVDEAIARISNNGVVLYRLHDAKRNIRYCHVNEHTALYYRPLADGVELLTLFDTRQNSDKLKL